MQSICDNDELISVETALKNLLAQALPITRTETVTLNQTLDRVLAEDIKSAIDVPPFHASVMDGYALDSRSLQHAPLPISQRIVAGQGIVPPLEHRTVAQIFTGAPLPTGADTVVAQECCIIKNGCVTFQNEVQARQFVRHKGSHIRKSSVLLTKGTRLGPTEIGLLATVGIETVSVYHRLKVTLLTTGNELVEPGIELQAGQIYNANQYLLTALLNRLNCEIISTQPVRDNFSDVSSALQLAAKDCDLILSSGGVSVGEEDHIKTAVKTLGKLLMWRIRIKPGKPLAVGEILGVPFIGLPGNPVSSFVTFCLFARPVILRCQGLVNVASRSFPVLADFERKTPDKRREYMRVFLHASENGQYLARPYHSQDSATLLSTTLTDGLLCIPEDTVIERGLTLSFTPFSELVG